MPGEAVVSLPKVSPKSPPFHQSFEHSERSDNLRDQPTSVSHFGGSTRGESPFYVTGPQAFGLILPPLLNAAFASPGYRLLPLFMDDLVNPLRRNPEAAGQIAQRFSGSIPAAQAGIADLLLDPDR